MSLGWARDHSDDDDGGDGDEDNDEAGDNNDDGEARISTVCATLVFEVAGWPGSIYDGIIFRGTEKLKTYIICIARQ